MASSYPSGIDSFNEPSLPEETALSAAGSATRNHTENHRDLGDAVEALQAHAAKKGHDHSGDASDTSKGGKLAQANTHQSADTDSAPTALHHTLGTGANQAAPGNHVHSYNDLTNRPWIICTSGTRPNTPTLGLLIYETDTYRMRVWAQYPGDGSPSWRYLLGPLPNCRLRQNTAQQLINTGTVIEWHEEIEDSFAMFDKNVSATNIVCKESGLYQIETAIQWDPQKVPDTAHVIVCLNNVETTLRQQQYLRGGNSYTPNFSQTITVAGKLRMAANDILTVKTKYVASGGLLSLIFSFCENPSQIKSRIDVSYLGP